MRRRIYYLERTGPVDYDESRSMVVIAQSPTEARKLITSVVGADRQYGDEGAGTWDDMNLTSCESLGIAAPNEKKSRVVCVDFNAG